MPLNTSGEDHRQDGFETLRSSAGVSRYGDSYAVILFDVEPHYVGRRVARFELLCCNTRYTYDAQHRWIRIIEYKRVRLDGVLAVPAIRVPLAMAVSAHSVLAYLHKSKQRVVAELLVAPP